MRALFIVNDPTLFDPRSASRGRMRLYARAIGTLHVLSCADRDAASIVDGPLVLHAGRGWKARSVFSFPERARHLIREYGLDIVSAQDPFEHGWVARTAARLAGARLHLQVHVDVLSPLYAHQSPFHRERVRLARWLLKSADGVRVVSARVQRSFAALGARIPHALAVIPDDVPRGSIRATTPPAHDFSFVCIAVGRLAAEKRYRDLLAAFARVRRRHPDVGLFVVGDGPQRHRLERVARALGLDGAVRFLGHRDDARGLLASAQIFLQASAYEGYGLTFVEAALAGVPMVATDVGIIGEVFQPGRDALVCPVGDVAGYARQLERLIEDDRLRSALARNAKSAVEAHLASVGEVPERIADDLRRLTRPATTARA